MANGSSRKCATNSLSENRTVIFHRTHQTSPICLTRNRSGVAGQRRRSPNDASSVSWYHEWLFRRTSFAFRDNQARDTALKLAREWQGER